MAFDELKEAGNEMAVKAKGRYRQEGKTYQVEDGDVIFFKRAPRCALAFHVPTICFAVDRPPYRTV